ncbi:pitrilysin family protein [Uliginosibacterium paludis]|uniref:Pitrilysin family protein n=1 Tax=Uliginosibacterium paludis TaxID=1615952 RepID=A0ABV2CML7_9RHOO
MTRPLAAFLLALLVAPAAAAPEVQRWTRPEGTRIQLAENHELPMLDVRIDFAAGAAWDPPGKSGVAALTNALLDAGAGQGGEQLDEHALADRLADIAAQLGGGIDDDRASLSLRVLSTPAERDRAVALMSLVLARPTFPASVLNRERQRSIAALRESRSTPGGRLAEAFAPAVYGDHAYGRVSNEASLARISRRDLLDFHQRYYTRANALITLVGDIRRSEAEALVSTLLAGLPRGSTPTALPRPNPSAGRMLRLAMDSSQAHIALGLPAVPRDDPDLLALSVGNHVLGGGGFNSRLMKEIRDARGLAYGVSSGFDAQAFGGVFAIQLETRATQADEAVKVVRETLARFLREGPDEAELEAARTNLINSLALSLDSNAKLLGELADLGFYRRPADSLETYPARVRAVTLEQVRAAFARHVNPEQLVTVIVGGR